ncbi:DNA-cytosine methyltransferase [Microbacterium esteraromaticum]|uniref:DNA-cytosine methyltransferase n=1 Tax=Microbacterium esteraromaticum TaxID=57043 RepID=A0A1R4JY05_9MICO|nr:DNA cytosine methyltransferase [Microbacterium esteraromaticum]SJN36970.1 DNA-cytosine methyltransferase [Microbacterium esteraromaticum]
MSKPALSAVPAEARLRRITVEEAAAIQTFPNDVPWQGAQSARFRQIGNAVPPKLAYEVAATVANTLLADTAALAETENERELVLA